MLGKLAPVFQKYDKAPLPPLTLIFMAPLQVPQVVVGVAVAVTSRLKQATVKFCTLIQPVTVLRTNIG